MLKVNPHPDYPTEEGRFIRGNDFSPVALAVILNRDADKIPLEIQALVRAGVESGAALSGTIQTPNIGFEKMICNIVANPNIRYLILGGPESDGHLTGEALKALLQHGVDTRRRIVGTNAPHPSLFNLPVEAIERFRKQVSLVDLQFEGEADLIRQAVWSCYQEKAVEFQSYSLYDPGAYPEPPMSVQIVWRVTQPWSEPMNENEAVSKQKAQAMIEQLRARNKKV
jgi:tetrahydromethanopterin S-methyltransferase subunit A